MAIVKVTNPGIAEAVTIMNPATAAHAEITNESPEQFANLPRHTRLSKDDLGALGHEVPS